MRAKADFLPEVPPAAVCLPSRKDLVRLEQHNGEVAAVWAAYRARRPVRVPVSFGINPRYTMFDHPANPRRLTFRQFFEDPQVMLERQLEHAEWVRFHVPQDVEMGWPADGWRVAVSFLNSYEAGWLGCPIRFAEGQIPDTVPLLMDDGAKRRLLEAGQPDPFTSGLMRRNWEFYDLFRRQQQAGWTWRGLPIVDVTPTGLGTDGPLTVACNVRGATEFMTDLAADPDYAWELLDFITEATIRRIRSYRQRLGLPPKAQGWSFADDSIQLISTHTYEAMVLPFHRRLVDALSDGGPIAMHLCGDSTRHFRFLRDVLDVQSFDTGFPIDFGWVREQVGPDVEIKGGPSVTLLATASPRRVREEVRRILDSGITSGGRFILREGNNLPPDVPLTNLQAMYAAARDFGRYL